MPLVSGGPCWLRGAAGAQCRGDALCGVAVPQGRPPWGRRRSKHLACRRDDPAGIASHQLIGAFGQGYGSLGVVAEGEAGDAENGGFFLYAAGVGEDEAG